MRVACHLQSIPGPLSPQELKKGKAQGPVSPEGQDLALAFLAPSPTRPTMFLHAAHAD